MTKVMFHGNVSVPAICLIFLVRCGSAPDLLINVYTDPQYGFRLKAPETGWTVTDETGVSDLLVVIRSETVVEGFIPNVTVAIEPLSRMVTPEEYGRQNLEALSAQGDDVISARTLVVNRTGFYELVCVRANTMPSVRFRYLCVVKDRIGFVITCAAPETCHENFTQTFESIVQSFHFL